MNMQKSSIEEYSPKEVLVGDIFEVSVPLYNLRIGTLVIAYHLDENGIYLLSEKIEPNTNYLIDDCHFSEKGSEKVSDLLANFRDIFSNEILHISINVSFLLVV